MINRSILAAIVALAPLSAAHAAGAADRQTFPGQCNFLAEPKEDHRLLTEALPEPKPPYVRSIWTRRARPTSRCGRTAFKWT